MKINMKMDKRELELTKLQAYIQDIDKEVTLLLQNLQWDHKHLLESPVMVSCKYMAEHRIPIYSVEAHEKQCYLTQEGYSQKDVLLPDPVNPNADTLVKLNKQDIMKVINTAASVDPSYKRGGGAVEPLSAARLQQVYSADERRAIHDAVVAAAPACHDLADLALPSSSEKPRASKVKSRSEILAELRDMKRRRAKYRVAANTANYSDVLRDVIKTQMEMYAEAKGIFIKTEYGTKTYVSLSEPIESENNSNNMVIKQERTSPDTDYHYGNSRRHRERSRTPDKRRQRNQYDDRGTVSKRSRHDYTESKRNYKDASQDRYSKEKRRDDDDYSNQKTYHRTKDTITNEDSDRYDRIKKQDASTSEHYRNNNDEDRRRYVDKIYNSKHSSRHDSSSKEHDRHRSYKDDHSKKDKYERRRKYVEYERSHEDTRYRQGNHTCYYDVKVKKEKEDTDENSNEERKKRHRN